ncbi:selenium cofactor biosynthesis protein YqeC [Schnuerera sp.]|uniref:selenium cofactor biosynthesis protein YqeC n=1 Tax=Schnuerera sp. TaxID=2794844 RepID=UPI002CB83EE7|nr:selenium cofactor biosynthesis protein YqeC [Schnuerera sp.]HSH36328.1 selenium cofactor biosynthesis protein YqeC [Schnuerera sp.]
MSIYESLELDMGKGEVLSLVGGGGKTTTIFELGKELKALKKKVLITTTTAIYEPGEEDYDYYFLGDIKYFSPKEGSITIFGDKVEKGKLLGITPEKVEKIIEMELFNFLLIEADGAKKKPIKAHASYEPVIPKNTTKTIGIIGLDSLDKKIEDIVHRPEIFMKITDTKYSDIIDEEIIVKYILNSEGIFKDSQGSKILLLNKACDEKGILKGSKIRQTLFENGFKGSVMVTDIKRKKFY